MCPKCPLELHNEYWTEGGQGMQLSNYLHLVPESSTNFMVLCTVNAEVIKQPSAVLNSLQLAVHHSSHKIKRACIKTGNQCHSYKYNRPI
jgi:hypothetical protein